MLQRDFPETVKFCGVYRFTLQPQLSTVWFVYAGTICLLWYIVGISHFIWKYGDPGRLCERWCVSLLYRVISTITAKAILFHIVELTLKTNISPVKTAVSHAKTIDPGCSGPWFPSPLLEVWLSNFVQYLLWIKDSLIIKFNLISRRFPKNRFCLSPTAMLGACHGFPWRLCFLGPCGCYALERGVLWRRHVNSDRFGFLTGWPYVRRRRLGAVFILWSSWRFFVGFHSLEVAWRQCHCN